MNNVAHFAYAQARLQARHGQRADEQVWRRLHSTGDLSNYLQMARQTVLRPWVIGIDTSQSSHDIEFSLRRQFCRYVDDVSHWLPADWRAALQALKRLPALPALQLRLQKQLAHAPHFEVKSTITAGLRICAGGACVDGSADGLLRERLAIEAVLLARINEHRDKHD